MLVAKEGAIVGCVGLSGQPQKQRLRKAQSKRELLPKLPDAVQQKQEGRGFLLDAGVGVGRMSAALLERVSRLEKRLFRNVILSISFSRKPGRNQTGNGVSCLGQAVKQYLHRNMTNTGRRLRILKVDSFNVFGLETG